MSKIVDADVVEKEVTQHGYFIFKTPETARLADDARREYFRTFKDYPMRSGGFAYQELIRGPIRKKNISSRNGLGEAYAQVLQTVYYPSDVELPAIAKAMSFMIAIRNDATDKPREYGVDPKLDGYWNACRVHHYPRGGGFMVRHRDTHFPRLLGEKSFLQVLFLMSRKGEDFEKGGGHIVDLKGEVIDLEDVGGLGAMVFFDGRIPHGVSDVDPEANFSFDTPDGRLSGVANLYEYRGN
jgi:hypothetical protein